MKKALKIMLEPILRAVYAVEVYVFNVTGKELPMLRRVWSFEGLAMQRALNRAHGTRIEYRGRI